MAKFSTDVSDDVSMPEPLIGAISLTLDETGIGAAMKLHQEELFHDSDAAQRNGELAVTLMTSQILANVEAAHRWSWQRFTLTWNPRLLGKYALMSRAIDRLGETQPLANARNSVYEVLVTVA